MNDAPHTASADRGLVQALDDYLAAWEAGNPPDRDAFLAQHPELADELKECLASLEFIRRAAVRAPAAPADNELAGPAMQPGVLGDFRIIRQVGRGGMGLVYEAEQVSLDRRVALKVLPFAATMDPRQLQRFQNEARAAASLEHPHIVPVYAVGCERGVHYYAMKFIDGQTLAAMIDAQRQSSEPRTQRSGVSGAAPLTPLRCVRGSDNTSLVAAVSTQRAPRDAASFRQIAGWGIQAAEALEHAHSVGIVHRDIKPANLMIDGRGSLWVTDFGLARTAADAGLTITGDVLGTLRYMSPEQALAKHGLVDHRTDVYSLGVTLYELLTLQPAFPGNDRQELLRQIACEEPTPPRRIDKAVPPELETIVGKLMEKNAADRYASAQSLADDLRRFLEHKPIRAKRPSFVQRVKKWARRHGPAVLTGSIVLSVALALLATGTLVLWQKEREKNEAFDQARQAREEAVDRDRTVRRHLYVADIGMAYEAWRNLEIARGRELLTKHIPAEGREDLRSFEWFYLWNACHSEPPSLRHPCPVNGVCFSPDGKIIATGGEDGKVRLWNAATAKLTAWIPAHEAGVNWVTFSPDGKRLASSSDDKTTRIWDVATLSLQKTLAWLPERVPGVIFLPGGKLRTASLQGATVTLWDADSWTPISTLKGHTEGIQCLRSSADGKLLATGSGDRTVRLWDTATGEQLAVFKRHEGTVSDVTFSHDGRWLASAGADKTINLWDVAQRAPKASFPGQGDAVQGLAFSPNDTILASCADDGMVRLWDPTTKSHLAVAARHTQRVWGVAFSPDGSTLASASEDGTVKVSRFLHGLVRNIGVNGSRPYHLAFSPDGRGLAQVDVSDGGIGRLWDLASGKLRAVIPGEGTHQVVFTPDGRTAITRCSPTPPRSCFLQISDLGTGELQRRFDDMESSALSPQGERLAMSNRSARIWVRTLQGQLEQEIRLPRGRTLCLAYHPDGNLLGVGTDYGAIWLHDFATSTWGEVPLHFYGEYNQIAFSPDGTTIAGQIESRFLCLCDLSTRRLRIHQDLIDLSGFAFSPDGKTLATTGTTGRVILWNVATGLRLLEWDVPNRVSYAIAFSKDGQTLAASGVANIVGTAYLWSAPRNIEVPAREEP